MQSILEGFDATSFHLIDEAINADPRADPHQVGQAGVVWEQLCPLGRFAPVRKTRRSVLEWLLLTTVEVQTFEDAWERIVWYNKRWGIEIFLVPARTVVARPKNFHSAPVIGSPSC